jgi:hypothetical protein
MLLKPLACLILLSAAALMAQKSPKTITLSETATVSANDIERALQKDCPDVSLVTNASKSDYKLEVIKRTTRPGLGIEHVNQFDLTLFDSEGNTVSGVTDTSLNHDVKEMCHAIRTSVIIEVVDSQTLTQSTDARGTGPGVVAATVNGLTGRRTHTDTSSIYVIVNGEHALLDCYEHRTGCATIGPGKYYGQKNGDGIWISYRMPITHEPMRNHYKIAGGW